MVHKISPKINFILSVYSLFLTIAKSSLTSFSESPRYLEVIVDDETEKNVVLHSVATAFASIVFPVPGGPHMQIPFQARLIP